MSLIEMCAGVSLSGGIKVSRWCSFCPCEYIADLVDTPFIIGIPFVLGISFTVGAESTSPIKLTSFNLLLIQGFFETIEQWIH